MSSCTLWCQWMNSSWWCSYLVRPCGRCVRLKRSHTCVDRIQLKRGRPRKNSQSMIVIKKQKPDPLDDHQPPSSLAAVMSASTGHPTPMMSSGASVADSVSVSATASTTTGNTADQQQPLPPAKKPPTPFGSGTTDNGSGASHQQPKTLTTTPSPSTPKRTSSKKRSRPSGVHVSSRSRVCVACDRRHHVIFRVVLCFD